jgi:hypothetical protein
MLLLDPSVVLLTIDVHSFSPPMFSNKENWNKKNSRDVARRGITVSASTSCPDELHKLKVTHFL